MAPELGKIITGDAYRDAIHVAVAPVVASEVLQPGEYARLDERQQAMGTTKQYALGIVDPFLTHPVQAGMKFWLFLLPGTITDMRHQWSHPAFDVKSAAQKIVEQAAAVCGITYEKMLSIASDYAEVGEPVIDNSEDYKSYDFNKEFWNAIKELTGSICEYGGAPFTCSC